MLWLFACASSDVSWAVQDGGVTVGDNSLGGSVVWSFFDAGWGNAANDAAYLCARAQALAATAAAPLQGCAGCSYGYTLALTELSTDCAGAEATDPAYTLPVAFGFGDVPENLAADDPHPDRALGWYASWDGVTLEPYGYAFDAAIESGGDPGPPGWNVGQSYTLRPAFAWDVSP